MKKSARAQQVKKRSMSGWWCDGVVRRSVISVIALIA
jgi:hypothetical protein